MTNSIAPSASPRREMPARISAVIALLTMAFAGTAGAQLIYKADNVEALNLPASWTGGIVPGSSDIAVWSSTVTGANNAPLGANTAWGGIRVQSPGGLVTVGTGANILTLGPSGVDLSQATQDLYLHGSSLSVGADNQAWNVGSRKLQLGNGGLTGVLTGSGTITISGSGLVEMHQNATGAGGFSGKWIVNSGATLRGLRNNANAWGTSTAPDAITLNGGTLAVGGAPGSGAVGNWTFNNPITLGAGTTSTISAQNPDANARSLNLDGPIVGSGNLVFSRTQAGAHSFYVRNFGATAGLRQNILGTGTVSIKDVAVYLYPSGAGAGAAFTLNNNFSLTNGALVGWDGNDVTLAGDITIEGANTIQSHWSGKDFVLDGTIKNGNATGSVTFNPGQNEGGNTIVVNGHNTYTGTTTLGRGAANMGAVIAKHGDAFSSGTILSRGAQLRAGTAGITIPNAIEVGAGGFRLGGGNAFTLSGTTKIDNASRTIANYGTATITLGNIDLSAGVDSTAAFDNAAGAGSGRPIIVAGAISGAGKVAFSSTANTTLNGANTYTGTTTIGGGTVNIGASGSLDMASAVTISGGSLNNAGTINGSLTVSSGTLNNAGTLAGAVSITGASVTFVQDGTVTSAYTHSAGLLQGTGSFPGGLTLAGGTLNIIPGALTAANPTLVGLTTVRVPAAPGTYRVLNYTGTLSGDPSNLVVEGAFRGATFDTSIPGQINVTVANTASLTWTGLYSGEWDINTTPNWLNGASEDTFFQADTVLFPDAGQIKTVNLNSTLLPAAVTVNNTAGNDYFFSGAGSIGGTASLTKSGDGLLSLGTANSFSGPVTVEGGTLIVGNASALGTTASGTTVAAGGALDVNGQTLPVGETITAAGIGPVGSAIPAAVTGGGTIRGELILSDDTSIGGASGSLQIGTSAEPRTIQGAHTLTKVGGNGVWYRGPLNGAGNSLSGLVINEGRFGLEGNNNALSGVPVTINPNAMLSSWGDVGGQPTIQNNPITLNGGYIGSDLAGQIYSGPVTLTADSYLGAPSSAAAFKLAGPISGPFNLYKTEGNTVTLAGTNAYTGGTYINNGTLQIGDGNQGINLIASGSGVYLGDGATVGNVRYRLNNDFTYNEPISFVTANSTFFLDMAAPTLKMKVSDTSTFANTFSGILQIENGVMSVENGAHFQVRQINLSSGTASDATLSIVNGALVTTKYLNVGHGSSMAGTVNQSGGTVTLLGGDADCHGMRLGHWGSGSQVNVYNLTGGLFDATGLTLNAGIAGMLQNITISWDGAAAMNIGGGAGTATAKVYGVNFDGGGGDTVAGSLNLLANGVLEVGAGSFGMAGANDKITFNGGTIRAMETATWQAPIEMTGAGAIETMSGTTVTLSRVLSGSGALSKTGAGTLVLNQANSHSGSIAVDAGELVGITGGSVAGTLNVAAGAKNTVRVGAAESQWSVAGVSYASGASVDIDFGSFAPSTTVAPIAVNGNLTLAGALDINVQGNVTAVGTYPLIHYTGTLSGTPPTLAASLPTGIEANIVNNTENKTIDLVVTVGSQLTWRVGDGVWDINTTANWKDLGNNATFYADGQPANFDDTATGTSPITVTLNELVNPVAVTVMADTKDYIITGAGVIDGSAALFKEGAARLTLGTDNTFTGLVMINEGYVQVGQGGAVGTLGGTGPITVATNATLAFNRADDIGIGRRVLGGGTVRQAGTGWLTNNAANNEASYVIESGSFAARGGGWDTAFAAGRTITVWTNAVFNTVTHSLGGAGAGGILPSDIVLDGGTWDLQNEQYIPTNALVMKAGKVISTSAIGEVRGWQGKIQVEAAETSSTIDAGVGTMLGPITFNVADGTAEEDLVVNGMVRGTYNIIKDGPGLMALYNAGNTLTGLTIITNGTLEINGLIPGSVSVTGGLLRGNNGTIGGSVNVAEGGSVGGGTQTTVGILQITGALNLSDGATIVMRLDKQSGYTSQDYVYAGNITYGGTLKVVATGEPLANGEVFYFFQVGGTRSGFFTDFDLPALPAGLTWDKSSLYVDGSIRVSNATPAPMFNPPAGGYVSPQSVTISSDPGSRIFYTMDGSYPSTSSPSGISPVVVALPLDTPGITIQAFATNSGFADSGVGSATYSTTPVPTWVYPYGGSWAFGDYWYNRVAANGSGVTADFTTQTLQENAIVTLDSAPRAGHLKFADVGNLYGWTITNGTGGPLTLDAGAVPPTITVGNTTTVIAATVSGTNGFTKLGAGTLAVQNNANNFTGDVLINAGQVDAGLTQGPGTTGPLGNVVGGRTVTVNDGAILRFMVNNIFGGSGKSAATIPSVVLNGGILQVNHFNIVGDVTMNDGATLRNANGPGGITYNGFQFLGSVTVGGNAGSTLDTITGNGNHLLGGSTNLFTVADATSSAAADLDVQVVLRDGSGDYPGVGAILKEGDGTLVLSSNNLYTGSTIVNEGTLLVNGSIASGAVIVNSGATFGGIGSAGGNVSLRAGATLSPGSAESPVGVITTAGQVWNEGASLLVDMNDVAQTDLATITGSLNIQASSGSPFVIKLRTSGALAGFDPAVAYSWVVAAANGGVQNFDASKLVLDLSEFGSTYTGDFAISNEGGDIVVNYIPSAPMSFSGIQYMGGSSFKLTFSGISGQSYRILTSSDLSLPLSSWTELTSGTFGATPIEFIDDTASGQKRFYTIVSP